MSQEPPWARDVPMPETALTREVPQKRRQPLGEYESRLSAKYLATMVALFAPIAFLAYHCGAFDNPLKTIDCRDATEYASPECNAAAWQRNARFMGTTTIGKSGAITNAPTTPNAPIVAPHIGGAL